MAHALRSGTEQECALRVDLTRSPHRGWTTAICAQETAAIDVNRTFLIAAGAIGAIRDREVLPSQLRSRLNVADKSQRRRDLGKLGRRRETFERWRENGVSVGGAGNRLIEFGQRQRRAQFEAARTLLFCDSDGGQECVLRGRGVGGVSP